MATRPPLPNERSAATDRDDPGPKLQKILDRVVAPRRITHAVMGVARGDGSLEWLGAAGEARPGVPMRPHTPYYVASVTKLYIATVILQLWERGDVDLDAPMTAYLDAELTRGLHRLDGVDHTPRITVRHLLSHTSGLPDYWDAPKGGRSLSRRLADGADLGWDLGDVVRMVREEHTPHFPPQDLAADRQKAHYSDTNFQLLLAIIEAVTGQGFHEVFAERIFRPLGLEHTAVPGRSEPAAHTPEPAAVHVKDRPLEIPQALASWNDLVSTAGDTLTLLRALTQGEVFADPATYRLMQERSNRIHYPLRYGLGTMHYRIGRAVAPGRQPVMLVGHSGITGSWLFHCPELDVLLSGTVNQMNTRSLPFRIMLRALKAVGPPTR